MKNQHKLKDLTENFFGNQMMQKKNPMFLKTNTNMYKVHEFIDRSVGSFVFQQIRFIGIFLEGIIQICSS